MRCNTNMGWDRKQRGDRGGYYYRYVRVNGRAVKQYVGNGLLAQLEAHQDRKKRAARTAARAAESTERTRLAEGDQLIQDAGWHVHLLVRAILLAAGYYDHHGEWRRRKESNMGMKTTKPKLGQARRQVSQTENEQRENWAELRRVADKANAGDTESLIRLRDILDANPWLWKRAGDMTAVAEKEWAKLLAGNASLSAESIPRVLQDIKEQLKGPHPTPMETLLVDQIAVTWLATRHAEIQAASPGGDSLQMAEFRLKRAESAQKRHLTAVKTLATLWHLLPAGLVPAKPLKLHQPSKATG